MKTETVLSRREATVRSAATTCLAGIALIQAIELPPLFVQGGQFAVLSAATMVVCVGLGLALAAAPARAARQLWGVVATTAALVLAGWAASHALSVPGLLTDRGDWAAMPGLAGAGLALVCLMLAIAAVPPTRALARGLATAVGVLVALAPPVGILLTAFGPGTAGGEEAIVLASGGHVHSHGSPENAIVYQPLPGGHGGHYVYKAVATPHATAFGVALLLGAALFFLYGAIGHLRRRSAQAASVNNSNLDVSNLERGLA